VKRVALVVDDDAQEYRPRIRTMLEGVGLEVREAADLDSVLTILEKEPDVAKSLEIVVLDMQMPHRGAAGTKSEDDAGVAVARLRKYRALPPDCPIVVFTAVPSYVNCVQCLKAGADDYVLKDDPDDSNPSIDVLRDHCLRLMAARRGEGASAFPSDRWLQEHGSWLEDQFDGQWVAFVSEDLATLAGVDARSGIPVRSGFAVVAGASFDEVRRKLYVFADIPRRCYVPIMAVRKH
jgi:CheY-like chemotaxis protein